MQKHIISTDKAPQAIGTYSQAFFIGLQNADLMTESEYDCECKLS
ncbi:MAG: hypothetical protein NZ775_04005 [Gammaproteobacteria bacterium]|nr:hypothetical protein [Gammaproteobacteria bacterium]